MGVYANYSFGVTSVATKDGDDVLVEPEVECDIESENGGETLKAIFDKHKVNISQYAEQRLKMTEQNLYKIFRGEGRPFWDVIVTICEDLGESLDQFRKNPLPKGHFAAAGKDTAAADRSVAKKSGGVGRKITINDCFNANYETSKA